MNDTPDKTEETQAAEAKDKKTAPEKGRQEEIGGPQGPEPTRYGDWEKKGRCVDF